MCLYVSVTCSNIVSLRELHSCYYPLVDVFRGCVHCYNQENRWNGGEGGMALQGLLVRQLGTAGLCNSYDLHLKMQFMNHSTSM